MPLRTRSVVIALALAALALPLVPLEGGRDVLQVVVAVGAVAVAWRVVLRQRHVLRLGWGLLVLAVSLLALADVVKAVDRDLLLAGLPLWDLLAFTGFVFLAAGFFQVERRNGRGPHLPGRAEAAIFATGLATALLVLLVHLPLPSEGPVVLTGYVLADLLVVTVIARLLLTDSHRSRSFLYLSAALFASLAGDVASWAGEAHGTGSPVARTLGLAGFVLFAAGVAHPSVSTFTSGGAWAHEVSPRRRVAVLGVGQALPVATLVVSWAAGWSTSVLLAAAGGAVVSVLVTTRVTGLLHQLREQASQLADLARSDDLTGLHNRRSWNFELARASRQAATSGRPLSVGLFDLDLFKAYNDTYGHPAGDRLLKAAAEAWRSALLPGEVLARYGGEEFAMLLPGTEPHEAKLRLDALRMLTPGGQSFSAGLAPWRPGMEPEQATADADTALYEAKRRGRDQVLVFAPVSAQATVMPFSMRTVVQPIVRLRDLTVVAYEALSRFDPATDVEGVFDQAHDQGYGDLLEGTAVQNALRLPNRAPNVELFVNVSERALASPQFWGTIPARLDGVVVELHETRHGMDDGSVSRLLDRFRERGARVCLDDLVGSTGDLERLVSLRPDMVKVDRSLVGGCDQRPELVDQITRLLRIATTHGVAVCAEGVETEAELLTLRGIGIGYVQGYLVGRPETHWVEPLAAAQRLGPLPGPQRRPDSAPIRSATT